MSTSTASTAPASTVTPRRPAPPNTHQMALIIWLSVFPTLTIINLAFGQWLELLHPVLRTLVLATVAVPIVIYGLVPQLLRLRARILTRFLNRRSRR
ncbi:MAG: hypothetical protein AVDCRST_MAG83-1016 [uncultured Arthrobacter sp.]|uniref:Uncharacterized protein n=1 Tax=uncultured Arthrobacter sp. TaxID=114050 RepID=A0A6J4H301_9MICC|nr:hypothetical protein [uncultured Arthrobacter sp.]CAA9209917.1 MAG: hypothetical protein AVDCRST_MAG83-1016 [uncultured Arthrobacter sp.]